MVEIYEGDNSCVKLVCLRRVSLPFRRSDLPIYIIEAHQGIGQMTSLGVPLAVSLGGVSSADPHLRRACSAGH